MKLKKSMMMGCFLLCLAMVLFILSAKTRLRAGDKLIKDEIGSASQEQMNVWSKTYESEDIQNPKDVSISFNPEDKFRTFASHFTNISSLDDHKSSVSMSPVRFITQNVDNMSLKHIKTNQTSPALYYCNFPSPTDAATAEEGKPSKSNWILKQVQVVIRHGDRSPIVHELYKKLGVRPDYCQLRPNRQPTHPFLEKFMKTMSSDHVRMQMQGRKFLASPFPKQDVCGSATLSQLGVVQHIHNGELLQKAYMQDHGLLAEAISDRTTMAEKVLILSTTRSRTIQSAVAFLYGLIPDFHLDQVNINYSNSDTFNMRPCASVNRMEKGIKNVRYNTYVNRQRKNTTFRKLSDNFDINDHSGVLIDSFVTGFLCKNFKLPCRNKSCVTVQDLDILLKEEEYMIQQISEKASFVNQSMLQLYPLMKTLARSMAAKISNKSSPDVILISGHDTTLKPMIRLLGIPEYRWPRLGTRLVFELWFDPDEQQHYIRILLNGKDYTARTNCCKDVEKSSGTFCTSDSFQSYVNTGIFQHFRVRNLEEACVTSA